MSMMNIEHRLWTTLALCVLLSGWSAATAEITWYEDFEAAQKVAREQKKDLLIDFSGSDWCVWCQRLDQEVFDQEAFGKEAGKSFVFVKLDFPRRTEQPAAIKKQNEALRAKFKQAYGFPGYPTVYLAGADGVAYARTGYLRGGPDAYLKHLDFLRTARPLEDPKAQWLENYEVAKAKAEALDKDILINFSGSDWCGWCIRLDREVFDQEYFKQQAPKDFVLLKLDFPRRSPQDPKIKAQNEKLAREYSSKHNFQGYPSIYLARANGEPYAMTGYEAGGPEQYLRNLRDMKKKNSSDG
jgi:thioredoxin-related protein